MLTSSMFWNLFSRSRRACGGMLDSCSRRSYWCSSYCHIYTCQLRYARTCPSNRADTRIACNYKPCLRLMSPEFAPSIIDGETPEMIDYRSKAELALIAEWEAKIRAGRREEVMAAQMRMIAGLHRPPRGNLAALRAICKFRPPRKRHPQRRIEARIGHRSENPPADGILQIGRGLFGQNCAR
jgi:hypothetical protein